MTQVVRQKQLQLFGRSILSIQLIKEFNQQRCLPLCSPLLPRLEDA